MAKCSYCKTKKGDRQCISLNDVICSVCCGSNFNKNITCDSKCIYLNKLLQTKLKKDCESIIKDKVDSVNPEKVGYDILCKTSDHSRMTYFLEKSFLKFYLDGASINDNIVKQLLKLIYLKYYTEYSDIIIAETEILNIFLINYQEFKTVCSEILPYDEQSKIILRLILSINNISGGQFGDYGYLNYLKNNIDRDISDGSFVCEDKFGNIKLNKLNVKND